MSRGDCGQFWSLHKPWTMPRSPLWAAQTRSNTPVTIYCCST